MFITVCFLFHAMATWMSMSFIGPPGRIRPYTARQQKVGNPYDFGARRHDHTVAHFLNMIPGDIWLIALHLYFSAILCLWKIKMEIFFILPKLTNYSMHFCWIIVKFYNTANSK